MRNVVAVYSARPSGPLSLFARVRSFSAQGFHNLEQERTALRVPAVRESVDLVPTEAAASAMAKPLPPPNAPYGQKRYSQKGQAIPADKCGERQEKILKVANRPLDVATLQQAVGTPGIKPVLNQMAFEGSLLRVGAEGLRSNTIRCVSTGFWAPAARGGSL